MPVTGAGILRLKEGQEANDYVMDENDAVWIEVGGLVVFIGHITSNRDSSDMVTVSIHAASDIEKTIDTATARIGR